MRKHHVCPKCEHDRILLIERIPDTGEYEAQVRPLHIALIVTGQGWLGDDKTRIAGQLSACVCGSCGYTELYTKNPASIPIDGKYVRELVSHEASETPYR